MGASAGFWWNLEVIPVSSRLLLGTNSCIALVGRWTIPLLLLFYPKKLPWEWNLLQEDLHSDIILWLSHLHPPLPNHRSFFIWKTERIFPLPNRRILSHLVCNLGSLPRNGHLHGSNVECLETYFPQISSPWSQTLLCMDNSWNSSLSCFDHPICRSSCKWYSCCVIQISLWYIICENFN